MIGVTGKVAVITGAASGIGRATAELFVASGARVVIADLDDGRGAELARRLGDAARFQRTDVSAPADAERLMHRAAEEFGRVDVVVNNAGVQVAGAVTELSESDWDRTFAVNVRGCFLTTRAAVPRLREAGGGAIVNVASIAGIKGGAGMSAYAASKGAVIALTTSLAAELAADGIRVNCVCPGWIDTPFNDPAIGFLGGREAQDDLVAATVPLRRQGTPREVAASILFLASDAASYLTSQRIVVDGGLV